MEGRRHLYRLTFGTRTLRPRLFFQMSFEPRDIPSGAALRSQGRHFRLDERARLEYLHSLFARRFSYERAAIWLEHHQTIMRQRLQPRSDQRPADPIDRGEFILSELGSRRQPV